MYKSQHNLYIVYYLRLKFKNAWSKSIDKKTIVAELLGLFFKLTNNVSFNVFLSEIKLI